MDDDELAVTSRGSRLTRVISVTGLGSAFAIGAATTGLAHPGHVVATVGGVSSAVLGISALAIDAWPPKLHRWVMFVAVAAGLGAFGLLLRLLLQDVLTRVG